MTVEASNRRHLLGLAAVAGVGGLAAACVRSEAAAPSAPTPGQPLTEAELDKLKGLTLRVVKSGDPMTMDYRQDRLTVEVDDKGKIVRASIV